MDNLIFMRSQNKINPIFLNHQGERIIFLKYRTRLIRFAAKPSAIFQKLDGLRSLILEPSKTFVSRFL